MATARLAEWIASITFQNLPDPVINAAIRSFQNSLGCIIGGSRHTTTLRALKALEPLFESKTCTLLGQERGGEAVFCDLQNAALINGIASHVDDYDDTHLHTVIHPAGAVVVGLLSYAEHIKIKNQRLVSGEEFITALVVGIEVGLRLGNSVSPNHYSEGWHITGTVSPVAVAAALASLMQLPADKTVNALGIACTQPVGIRVHFGTDTKPFHAGRASQNGILAAILAQGGFTADRASFEGRRGWVEVLGNGANSLDEQLTEMFDRSQQFKTQSTDGDRSLWEIEKNTFKPFPCGIVIHPIIDACIQLGDKHGDRSQRHTINASQIESVKLRVHPLVLDLTGKKEPKDGLEAKFSVYHGAAVGLALGSATPKEYENDVVLDPNVIGIRDKIVAEIDETLRSDEAVVKVVWISDGQKNEEVKHIEHAVGSLEKPMSNAELKDKFLGQAKQVIGDERASRLESLAWEVRWLADVTKITEATREGF